MHKRFLPIVILIIGISFACTTPALPFISPPTATLTPSPVPTATSTPTPTPVPTPLPAARVAQADNSIFRGDYEQALKDYQAVLAQSADVDTQAAAMLGIGRVDYLTGNYTGAVNALTVLSQDYQESYSRILGYYFLGQSYDALNKPRQAADAYGHYLSLKPGVLDAYMQELRGDSLLEAGDYEAAIEAYQAAIKAPQLSDPNYLEIKVGKTYAAEGDYTNAVRKFMSIYETTNNDYVKAQMDLLAGQSYIALEHPEQAYARFQDAVENYPRAYDSYTGLVELVKNNVPINDLDRGLVDYFAGQYAVATEAFNRYIRATPEHDGTVHQYKALSLQALGQYDAAIAEWDSLINDHKGDRFWAGAWDEKAYTQWAYLDQFDRAAETLLDFIKEVPTANEAPAYLFEAGRIFERNNKLSEAAATWERLINEYPSADQSYQALYLAGVTYFRLGDQSKAQSTFQRVLVLATTPSEQASAYLWIGKTQLAQKNQEAARASWDQAAQRDPTGYYSERARQLLQDKPAFSSDMNFDLAFDLNVEKVQAEDWLRKTFNIPADVSLDSLGQLAADPRVLRGNALYELGLYDDARAEFDSLLSDIKSDPANNFRILGHLLDLGFYRQAIITSRQILTLANMDDTATLNAPIYFNHIRFGSYFRSDVIAAANKENFDPLFLFAVIRQESLFDGSIESTAGARGLMQIMPDTGQEIASQLKWPAAYQKHDLFRPMVNIALGAHYLARQRDYFNQDLFAALAAYNGGPGNTQVWRDLAHNDPDLFLEVIRPQETRDYIMQVFEFMQIYEKLYQRNQ